MRCRRIELKCALRAGKVAFVSAIFGSFVMLGSVVGARFALAEPARETETVAGSLPGTAALTVEGDLASQMIDAIDQFLDRETARTVAHRNQVWKEQFKSGQWPEEWIASRKTRLAKILGVTDPRVASPRLSILAPPGQDPVLASGPTYDVFAVRWDVFSDVTGEGLLLVPRSNGLHAAVIAIPDADVSPEALAGLSPGVAPESQFARRLAESGCTVLIPQLIPREIAKRRNVSLTHREYLYRPAYELGRHIIGYEVQKILAAVDYFSAQGDPAGKPTIAVIGWGEGGMLALYAAALDDRIATAAVSGFFGPREGTWSEPVDRNIFSLLKDFGCAEISLLVHPRPVIVEAARGPEVTIPNGLGGAPGNLFTPQLEAVQSEAARANELLSLARLPSHLTLITSGDGRGPYGSETFLKAFLQTLDPKSELNAVAQEPQWRRENPWQSDRVGRQIDELDRHIQTFLEQSSDVRRQFWSRLDTSSLAKFSETVEWYREYFYEEVIGRIDLPLSAPNPRSRRVYDEPKWTGYEVVLDVFDGVFAYGILLVPKDIRPGERRPVVVCQHGLEGRPQDTIEGDHRAYHNFAARLAEQGFVVFAPQNPYIFGDRFRTLQRKANPLGKTLFSIIVPQHQQIVNWLSTLEFVDPARIAFYGLSYGGKTAMRVPPLVPQYCLSICSADFNDWVWKNASTRSHYSYVFTGEYEIFEFDLGETFNYAEMATLIAPRPFMVERGHFDGVAPDERVAYEYAKVRFLYEALLGLTDKTEIEWFVGPHTIHGVGTFKFLHRHLGF
ncbi:MAG: dienelactone hydrolase family protein [Thermogutta sp.]